YRWNGFSTRLGRWGGRRGGWWWRRRRWRPAVLHLDVAVHRHDVQRIAPAVDFTGHAAAAGVRMNVQREGSLHVAVDLREVDGERRGGRQRGDDPSIDRLKRRAVEIPDEVRADDAVDRSGLHLAGAGGDDVDH